MQALVYGTLLTKETKQLLTLESTGPIVSCETHFYTPFLLQFCQLSNYYHKYVYYHSEQDIFKEHISIYGVFLKFSLIIFFAKKEFGN